MDLLDASLGDIAARLVEMLENEQDATGREMAGGAGSSDSLLEIVHEWEAVGRASDAARAWAAAEVEQASARELEANGLAYRHGFATAKKLLAATANISVRTAAARIGLGRDVRSSLSNTGMPLPSRFPAVEKAFYRGQIGVDAASVICRTLAQVVPRTGWSVAVEEAEVRLVEAAIETVADGVGEGPDLSEGESVDASGLAGLPPAARYTVDGIALLAARIREHLDPDGAEPRDAVKQSLRGFSHPRVGADGIARGRYALPPLQLGVFLTAIDSILSPRTADRAASDEVATEGGSEPGGVAGLGSDAGVDDPDCPIFDDRTHEQKLLDAVMTLIEMAAASPAASRLNGSAPTVNVHVTMSDLTAGHGVGWIDGSPEPIPMSTIEMLRCDGDTILTVFGARGQVLSQGKTQRLASRRQRRALAARDGGCVIPGCTVPPSRCQAHHVIPWVGETFLPGRTDLDNLALLCPFHHSTIHTSAWQLVMIDGKPHVKPPDWRGARSSPRPTGQRRTGRP